MEQKEIKITVPEGYEIDKENSTFECIKFKKKVLVYNEICEKLTDSDDGFYYASSGTILHDDRPHYNSFWAIGSPSYKQVTQLVALNKLMNVATYLNTQKFDWSDGCEPKVAIGYSHRHKQLSPYATSSMQCSHVYFNSIELAKQAIEILGEHVVKTALGVFE